MSEIKYYMNNPCVVIREVTEEFSEIKLSPNYTDGLSGDQWCIPCMCGGGDGSHPSHSCETYQNVIDEINDSEASMVVMAENRLINDKPVEFKVLNEVRARIDTVRKEIAESRNISKEASKLKNELLDSAIVLKKEIEGKKEKLLSIENDCDKASLKLEHLATSIGKSESDASLIIGDLTISMGIAELKSMIKDSILLRHLQSGGVDNWEWYSESLPNDDDLNAQIVAHVQSLKVQDIK